MSSTRPKQFVYSDEEIRDLRGNRFYMRTKHDKKSRFVVASIRTQRAGKGKCLARVRYLIMSDDSVRNAMVRLVKRWRKFYFVVLVPAWSLEVSKL